MRPDLPGIIASAVTAIMRDELKAAKMRDLRERYGVALEDAISRAKLSGARETVEAFDGAKAYAYTQSGGRIAWGINSADNGFNIWRGIRIPDGADEAVM